MTWEHWGSESFNVAITTAFCAQTCVCPWTFRSFCEENSSWWSSIPSIKDDDCAGTFWTWLQFSRNACEVLLEVVPEDTIVFLVMKPIIICVDPSRNKTCVTGLTRILENCIKGLCIHLKSQCGAQFPQVGLLVPGSLRKMKSQWQWIQTGM